jgi:hypothetical protein
MITPELVKQAIESAHSACEKDCIHYQGIIGAEKEVAAMLLATLFVTGGAPNANPPLSLFAVGLHVGYRLRELEEAQQEKPVAQSEVN